MREREGHEVVSVGRGGARYSVWEGEGQEVVGDGEEEGGMVREGGQAITQYRKCLVMRWVIAVGYEVV